MKRIHRMIAVVVLSGLATSAAAQNRVLARTDIPFSFSANEQSLEAGAYELRQIGAHTARLQQVSNGRGVTLLSAQNIGEGEATKLVFRSYGKQRFLASVGTASYQISLPKSQAEAEVAAQREDVKTVSVVMKH